ncbi:MAG TPA: hypothetical protein DEA08_17920 [Planctomycetes bacterium]|nr:hypothetical protein [Planctomycetota bacterium]
MRRPPSVAFAPCCLVGLLALIACPQDAPDSPPLGDAPRASPAPIESPVFPRAKPKPPLAPQGELIAVADPAHAALLTPALARSALAEKGAGGQAVPGWLLVVPQGWDEGLRAEVTRLRPRRLLRVGVPPAKGLAQSDEALELPEDLAAASLQLAKREWGKSEQVVVAPADQPQAVILGAALAAQRGAPLLLGLPEQLEAGLKELGAQRLLAVAQAKKGGLKKGWAKGLAAQVESLGLEAAEAALARGYAKVPLQVVLSVSKGEATKELERVDWTPPAGPETSKPFVFRGHEPEAAGSYVYEVRLVTKSEQAPGEEPITSDDAKSAPVKVTEETTRVLLVAGGPCFEYHFLRARSIREKSVKVSVWLQSAVEGFKQPGNVRIESLPTTLEALQEFDCVVLLDPNPVAFSTETAEALKRFVAEYHGGLLYVPGPKYSGRFLGRPELKPILDLLPVVPGDLIDFSDGAVTRRAPLKATLDGGDHPATRIAAQPERCRALWSRLPGPFFSYPVKREKAGALVLVRHDLASAGSTANREGRPLVVAHYFQGGPVLFQGTDETWRWRSVAAEVYDRYWVSMLRFLIQGRLAGGRKRVELITDKELYELGEPVRLRAQAFDPSFRPLQAGSLKARAKSGDDELEVTLEPIQKRPGWFTGSFLPPRPGPLEVSIKLPDDDPGKAPESVQLSVRQSNVEFLVHSLDLELLGGIAAATSGAVVAPAEVGALPEQIPLRTEQLTVAEPPIPLWDGWHVLALLCLLLGVEWVVRKKSKMI